MTAPADPPAVWWSPSTGMTITSGPMAVLGDDRTLPADAVRLVPGTLADADPARTLLADILAIVNRHRGSVASANQAMQEIEAACSASLDAAGAVPDTGQPADPMDLGEAIALVRARVDSFSYLDFGVSDDLDAVRTVLTAAAAAAPDTGQPAAASAARCAADEGEACICRSDEPCMLTTCPDSACHAVERAAVAAAYAGVDAASSPSGDTEKPCVRCSSRGAPVCCCVDGPVPDTGQPTADDLPARLRFAYSEAAHLGWHGVAATLLDLAGQLEPGDDDDSDEVCAAIARALASSSPSGDTGPPVVGDHVRWIEWDSGEDGPSDDEDFEIDQTGFVEQVEGGYAVINCDCGPRRVRRMLGSVEVVRRPSASPSGDTGQEARDA